MRFSGRIGENPGLTVCQLHQAASALVRSLWLTGQVRTRFLEKECKIIQDIQERNQKSQRSHVKARKRRLHELGINLSSSRCCIMNKVAL